MPPGLSPERTALGEAIAAALAAKAKRNAALAAEEPAISAVSRARDRVEAAEAEVVAARAEGGRQAAASLMAGDVLEAPTGVRQARAALIDAEEDLAVAIAARDSLNERRVGDDDAVRRTQAKLEDAICSVIRAEAGVQALAQEVIGLQKQLADKAAALIWLSSAGAVPKIDVPGGTFGRISDPDIHSATNRMLMNGIWSDLMQNAPSVAALKAARIALETDATAPLPSAG